MHITYLNDEAVVRFTFEELEQLRKFEKEKIRLAQDIISISNEFDTQERAKQIISKANESKNLLY